MYNHQCPCCLRGTVPNDYYSTPASSEEATDFNHKREHIAKTTTKCRFNDDLTHTRHQASTPQNRKNPLSNELLQQQQQGQQSSKYFDVCCQNLAIYTVSDPLQINCCKQENSNCRNVGCWHVQNGRINQTHHHPSNNNQINCNRCCSRCCITTAALSPDNTHCQSVSLNNDCIKCANKLLENNHHKIDENSLLASSNIGNDNTHRDAMSDSDPCQKFSVSRDDKCTDTSSSCSIIVKNNIEIERNCRRNKNKKKMSSGDNNCRKNKKELGIWTEYTELLLGNSRKRNLGSITRSKTAAITSIFSSVFLLITLLPSFTLAGGKYTLLNFICFF